MSYTDCDRLNRELVILQEGELKYQLPAAPIARQLVAEAERLLPDVLPERPMPLKFDWPANTIDLTDYWRAVDRRKD